MTASPFRRVLAILAAATIIAGFAPMAFARIYNPGSSGTASISSGGTGTTTQVTNGVNYYDGTRITSGTALTFTGANFGIASTSPSTTFGLVGNAYVDGGLGVGSLDTTSGTFKVVSTNYPQMT